MTTTREQIIEATCAMLENQGYHASGLNQIVAESGAPKGSLYYYFPGGKEELAAEAIGHTGRIVAQRIRQGMTAPAEAGPAIRRFVRAIADGVELSGFRAGGPLTAVAMETATHSERLNLACRAAFDPILAAFAERLVAGGFPPTRAAELATFITAAVEGGIILSRTQHSGEPLRRVADELGTYLTAAAG